MDNSSSTEVRTKRDNRNLPIVNGWKKLSNKPRNKNLPTIKPVTNIRPYIEALIKAGKPCKLVPRK